MFLQMPKGKIHRARITMYDVNYEGALSIDSDILNESGILPFEKILVYNITQFCRKKGKLAKEDLVLSFLLSLAN